MNRCGHAHLACNFPINVTVPLEFTPTDLPASTPTSPLQQAQCVSIAVRNTAAASAPAAATSTECDLFPLWLLTALPLLIILFRLGLVLLIKVRGLILDGSGKGFDLVARKRAGVLHSLSGDGSDLSGGLFILSHDKHSLSKVARQISLITTLRGTEYGAQMFVELSTGGIA